jgi:hypothetical protein
MLLVCPCSYNFALLQLKIKFYRIQLYKLVRSHYTLLFNSKVLVKHTSVVFIMVENIWIALS